MVLTASDIISLKSINQLIFLMVKIGVLFEVRTEILLNIIQTSFGFKELKDVSEMEQRDKKDLYFVPTSSHTLTDSCESSTYSFRI
jgi:hypothetical protein